jgi:hypothetical protein
MLVEDNYFHQVPNIAPIFGVNGSAFAYNYGVDFPYSSPGWLSQMIFFHGSHCHYNLFEGNWVPSHYHNQDSGCHSRNNLFFRERLLGWDAADGGKNGNTQSFSVEDSGSQAHQNLVVAGCVMGKDGYHTAYNGGIEGNSAIWAVEPNSNGTLLRLANYNTVNDAIPSNEALGSGQALVNSYLHSAKPAWFGNLPWPWCTPTNYAQSNEPRNLPAGYRAINGVDPAGGGSIATPSAPSNLRITG